MDREPDEGSRAGSKLWGSGKGDGVVKLISKFSKYNAVTSHTDMHFTIPDWSNQRCDDCCSARDHVVRFCYKEDFFVDLCLNCLRGAVQLFEDNDIS